MHKNHQVQRNCRAWCAKLQTTVSEALWKSQWWWQIVCQIWTLQACGNKWFLWIMFWERKKQAFDLIVEAASLSVSHPDSLPPSPLCFYHHSSPGWESWGRRCLLLWGRRSLSRAARQWCEVVWAFAIGEPEDVQTNSFCTTKPLPVV